MTTPERQNVVAYGTLARANAVRQAEWDPTDKITLEFRGNELAGETGEACNVIKKLARERMGLRGSRTTLDALAEELADVVICADLCAMMAGINLEAAVVAKFNATSEKYGLRTRLDPVAARDAEVARLREIVAKLPETADGVPVTPGMTVHAYIPSVGCTPHFVTGLEVGYVHAMMQGWQRLPWDECYSTKEAAENAYEAAGLRHIEPENT